jgi:glycosyltransferase involved in cell wall biosynthesis
MLVMGSASSSSRGRVGISAQLLSGQQSYRRAGIHHYIAQTLSHLPHDPAGLDYTVFAGDDSDFAGGGPSFARGGPSFVRENSDSGPDRPLRIVKSRWPTGRPLLRILWEQLALPLEVGRRRLDLLHGTAFVTPLWVRCPTVVTIYDLSFIHFPERFTAGRQRYLAAMARRSSRSARRVVTISESGRQDVHRVFGVPLDRIDVVQPGVTSAFSPRPAEEVQAFRERQNLATPFVLHVGTLEPRKNLLTLVEAFASLAGRELQLLLVGGRGWLYDELFARVQELGIRSQVRFTGYVPDADLPLWYNAAALLAYPSVYEGFGMPVVQAMASGTPVIAANTSSIPEVAGRAARFFEPHDVEALAGHMATVLDDPEVANTMRREGLSQAKNFSWRRAGRELAAVYLRALKEA